MSDTEEPSRDKQLKIVIVGDGSSGKVYMRSREQRRFGCVIG